MPEERKNSIPVVSDEEILKCTKECDGSEKSIINTLQMNLRVLADIRVFLRKIYKKLPEKTDKQVLSGE
ncbi:MAG: hypothetical protein PVG65_00065 [Candidatus Thorarchaeota archaeon]|jgi:hypothetical protein